MSPDPWQFVERVAVRKIGRGFLGEARFHAFFETGELSDDPHVAMLSAVKALDAAIRLRFTRTQPASAEPFGDLL